MEIRLTRHARRRCVERFITEDAVRRCVRDPDRVVAVPLSGTAAIGIRFVREFEWGCMAATVRQEGERVIVITVTWEIPAERRRT